ncbi:CvpA family protein [Bombella sp. TMW 2.2559]|uniref:CvpA family protein n=1 Tax=Bombella dulcis TaxID=2967339 RepID=A0ABT3WB09_9PROT|nr:CvpA family protein [Bombella dulcis]MCX5616280.1 CvpA family protein [Bombella dulcis]
MTGLHGTFLEHLGLMDWGILALIGLSALWGLVRGLSRESGALLVWVGSFWLVGRWGGPVLAHLGPFIAPSFQGSPVFIWGGRLGLFVFVMIILNLVTTQLARGMRGLLSGPLDALLGTGFGLVRGYVVLVLLFCAGSYLAQDWLEAAMQGSVLAPFIVRGVAFLQGYIPLSWSEHLAFLPSNSH